MPNTGRDSVTVPGAVSAWVALSELSLLKNISLGNR
jgi:hypothetical protein